MCVIIDTCSFVKVFDPKNLGHKVYKPIYDWLIKNKGSIIIGGSKYREEIGLKGKKRKLNASPYLSELKKKNVNIWFIDDSTVDTLEANLKIRNDDPNFNDPHIIAMAIVTKCKLICTSEKSALVFFKDHRLYPNNFHLPMIYRNLNDSKKLTPQILTPCREAKKGAKK